MREDRSFHEYRDLIYNTIYINIVLFLVNNLGRDKSYVWFY